MVVESKDTGEKIAQMVLARSKSKEKIIDKYLFYENDLFLYKIYEIKQNRMFKVRVKGRLKTHSRNWHSIGCNKYILSVIENDCVIPFFTTPKKLFLQNNQSALKNSEFVSEAVSELLNTGRILEVDKKYGVCSKSSFS